MYYCTIKKITQICIHANEASMSIGVGSFSSSMSHQQSSGAGLGAGGGATNTGTMAMADRVNTDFPPFSRVFVVCSRGHKEEDIQAAFQQFGNIEDVWMVKDRMTKENKGICYVKYDKASSAALAIENMDGKLVGNEPKPIKVYWDLLRGGGARGFPPDCPPPDNFQL